MLKAHVVVGTALLFTLHAAAAHAQTCTPLAEPSAASAQLTHQTARLLAGMPVDKHPLTQDADWQDHARAMDAAWKKLRDNKLTPLNAFAQTEVAPLPAARGALYYPFSGADFLYAHALFPQSPKMVLVGLEPTGNAPVLENMDSKALDASLAQLRASMKSLLNLSFFLTNNMRRDFRKSQLKGTAPILMTMAVRLGYEVRAVDAVSISAKGELCQRGGGSSGTNAGTNPATNVGTTTGTEGIRLLMKNSAGETRELLFFSVDLHNKGFKRTPQFATYIESLGRGPVFLKSASYLMHKPYFSDSQNLIQKRATMVLQDDSGIPYKSYPSASWDTTLYGAYDRPIRMFKQWRQPALERAYAQSAKPLTFGIGYEYKKGTSNLQRFVAREAVREAAQK
jgi:hypothetical protein